MSLRPKHAGKPHKPEKEPDWCAFPDLASTKVGGKVLFATNEWFAHAEKMIAPAEPVSQFGKFTDQGQWMDGWETARKRIKHHDWCIIRLGVPGTIKGFEVSTAFFTGNYAPKISIQAACMEHEEEPEELRTWKSEDGRVADDHDFEQAEQMGSDTWQTLLPKTPLRPGYKDSCRHFFDISSTQVWTHLRVNIFPDGGVARLRVHGNAARDIEPGAYLNLLAIDNGAVSLAWSDTHYGHPKNLMNPGRGVNMGDGWETARKSDRPEVLLEDERGHLILPGNEWCILQLGVPGIVRKVEIDTLHFKGNYPESALVEGLLAPPQPRRFEGLSELEIRALGEWEVVLPRTKLGPHQRRVFKVPPGKPVSHIKMTIFPDGGVSRLKIWGEARPDLWNKQHAHL